MRHLSSPGSPDNCSHSFITSWLGTVLEDVKNSCDLTLSWKRKMCRRQTCPSLRDMTRPVAILGSGRSNQYPGILGWPSFCDALLQPTSATIQGTKQEGCPRAFILEVIWWCLESGIWDLDGNVEPQR